MTTATTKVLNADQRRFLDAQTQRAREAAQRAAEDALRALAVAEPSRPGFLNGEQNKLRLALRDKARQLGDDNARAGAALTNLMHDVAYEQWHRLLFARFLEVNGLLRHPDYRDIPLSLEDCGDLASDLGIAPSIVLGQAQRITGDFAWGQRLKVRLIWAPDAAEESN